MCLSCLGSLISSQLLRTHRPQLCSISEDLPLIPLNSFYACCELNCKDKRTLSWLQICLQRAQALLCTGVGEPSCATAKQQERGQTRLSQPVLLPMAPRPPIKLGRLPGAHLGSTVFWVGCCTGWMFPKGLGMLWCCRIRGLILYWVGNKPARVYLCLPLSS